LFSSAGKPHRLLSIFDSPIENNPVSHHPGSVLRIFRNLPARVVSMELSGRVCIHGGRCVLHVL
jgi:hypothetical protein